MVPDVTPTPDDPDDNDDVETFQSETSTALQTSNPYKKLNGHVPNLIKNYPKPKDDPHSYDDEHYEVSAILVNPFSPLFFKLLLFIDVFFHLISIAFI